MKTKTRLVVAALAGVLGGALPASAVEWYVAPGGSGSGTSESPFSRIQDALNVAQAGDTIIVRPGTYTETLSTVRPGADGAPIVLRSEQGRGTVLVTALGRVANFSQPYIVVDGFVFDGQYGLGDAIRVTSAANSLVLRNTEVRRATNDLIDMGGPTGVLIENCLIHHALNAAGGRTDAHGIAAGPVRDFTVRNTEIHTFSGDGIQVDPGRSAPGWNNVTIEHAHIWLAPLPAPENGFPAGIVTGENAIDTKASTSFARATIVMRDIVASGFRDIPSDVPPNQAAFNLKENIDATVDGVTVYDSEIAFRLRGPAQVAVKNAVVYNTLKAVRYEDNITNLRFWNNTIGDGVRTVFEAASASPSGLDIRNLLVLGALPAEAAGGSNLSVGTVAFVNVAAHDYHLAAGSPAIDVGSFNGEVPIDRDGIPRPQGVAYDVGAYEWIAGGGGGGGNPNVAPSVGITSPADGASFTAPASVLIDAIASDSDGTVVRVDFFANGALIGSMTTPPYSIAWSGVPAGVYTLSARAIDNSGANTTSAGRTITVGSGGGGMSPDGTRVPPATQIVDNTGAVWTLNGLSVLRNGQQTGGAGTIIAWCGSQVYVFGTDSQWWRWNSGWSMVGTSDPCGTAALPASGASPDGTRLPPAPQIVDSTGAVWTIDGLLILHNGQQTGGYGTIIAWCSSQIYVFGTDSQWWRWNDGWSPLGPVDPCSSSSPPPSGASPDGTRLPPATQIVDNTGAVWTIDGLSILRNGEQTGGAGTIIAWCSGQIYVFGTDSQWWRWADGWVAVGAIDPCGGGSDASATPENFETP